MRSKRKALAAATALAVALVVAAAAFARSAGDLDPSFGHHGLRIVRSANDPSRAVAVGRKGKIVVTGGNTVARLRQDGRLDRSFADRGIATLGDLPGASYPANNSAIALSPKGGVFVAGEYCSGSPERCGFAVTHLKRTGHVDRSFGQDGTALLNFQVPEAFSASIAIGRGGKPVVTGLICRSYLRDCNFALARLDRDGHPDHGFGDGGTLVASVGPGGDCPVRQYQLSPMAIDSQWRIVMGAYCAGTVSVARFTHNGRFDRSFGNHGKVNKRHLRISAVTALTTDPKNRIDVAGPRRPNLYGVARFRPNGKIDASFGHRGKAGVRFNEKQADYATPYSAAVDSRGRIVLAGTAFGFSFARFTAHGHVDRHFGHHGHVVTGHSVIKRGGGQGLYGATSVAIDRRDRIVASGIQRNDRQDHFAVMRLLG